MSDSPNLDDPLFRLRTLYSCRKEGSGQALKFKPRPEQEVLFRHLVETPQVPAYIIKSRRLGISTAVDTFMADRAVFSQGFRGLLIDKTQADATKKMVEIVRFAIDSLDPRILSRVHFDKRNDSELRLRFMDEEEAKDSVIFATTGGRGGDCSMLHVSEWGPIAAVDPPRSTEIRTGAFPAARLGRRVVETTWMGGKSGDLWEMVKPILEADPNAEGIVYFFPWHADPAAIRISGMVTPEIEHYFRELAAKLGQSFSESQKRWYASKRIEQGIFVKREYPSSLEEAFSAPVEGSIYGPVIDQLRAAGRVRQFEWDRSVPVFAAWDIGWADSTSIWLFQLVGVDVHWIWHARREHHTAAQMVQLVAGTAIPVTSHFLPHDAAKKDPKDGKDYRDSLREAGLQNMVTVPRTLNIWVGIDYLRSLLAKSWFRVPACEDGLNALAAYHTRPTTSTGTRSDEPVHDAASHDADAARYVAEALKLGLVATHAGRRGRHVEDAPRFPDGGVVMDVDAVMAVRRRNRAGTALSGRGPL